MASAKTYFKLGLTAGVLALGVGGFFVLAPSQHAGAQMPGGPQGPMPVMVNIAKKEPVMIWREFSGRLTPVDYAIIRPQVSGTITEIKFEDGQHVEAGDVLMVIDPRPYSAALKEARANLSSAKNAYALAKLDLDRAEELISSSAISKRILDERKATAKSALASVNAAEAQVAKAEVDLDHAYVKAPISGRVSRAELTVGNVAQAAGLAAPELTSIVSDAGIYADFEVDEQTYLSSIRSKAKDNAEEQMIPVQILLGGNDSDVVEGYIRAFDNHIDPATGTIRARAYFNNENGILLPGMYVKVRLGSPSEDEHIMVSEASIGTDQDRKFVYIVDETGTVKYRQIEIGQSVQGRRVVDSGLEPGDKVIAEGIIKIRPEMPVQPMTADEWAAMQAQQAEAAKAAAAGAAEGGAEAEGH